MLLRANKFMMQDAFWTAYGRAYRALYRTLEIILWLLELLLFLRLAFKFLRANSETLVVRELYRLTDLVLYPFQSILPDYVWRDRPIELAAVSAMVGYSIASIVVLRLVKLFRRERRPAVSPPMQYR